MKQSILTLILSLSLMLNGFAANYYVSTSGNNSNAGTSISAAWQTIQFGVDQINSGDTLFVMDGDYLESVNIANAGSANAFKTLKAFNKWSARVINTQNYYVNAIHVTANYWNIIGLEVFHNNLNVDAYGHGIYISEAAHVTVKNNKVHDNGGSGIQYDKFDYAIVEGNICYNNANYNPFQGSGISLYQAAAFDSLPGYHIRVSNNICYNNLNITTNGVETTDGNGIIIDDFKHTQGGSTVPPYPHRTLVDNNLCYLNGGKGLHAFYSDFVDFFNNTAYHNNYDLANGGSYRAELSNAVSDNCVWRNNIGISNPGAGILASNCSFLIGYSDIVTFENNLTFNGVSGDASINFDNTVLSISDFTNNLLGINPHFQDAGANNFRLQSNSPCINSGSNQIVSFIDLEYNIRTLDSIDIGCYEKNMALGAETLANQADFIVSPNPSSSHINISNNDMIAVVEIRELSGKLIKTIENNFDNINIDYLANGVYLLTIRTQQKTYINQKIVKY